MAWLFIVTSVEASSIKYSFYSHDADDLTVDVLSPYLTKYSSFDSGLCHLSSELIVYGNQDVQDFDNFCQQKSKVFGIYLQPTDFIQQRKLLQGVYSSPGIGENLQAASEYIEGTLAVLYSENSEKVAIESFQRAHPDRSLIVVHVKDSSEAIKALGRSVLKSSAVVIGINSAIFSESFLLTARKISLKFSSPLIGGSTEENLKKGITFGVFTSQTAAIQATKDWMDHGRLVQPRPVLLMNHKMMAYFGVAINHE